MGWGLEGLLDAAGEKLASVSMSTGEVSTEEHRGESAAREWGLENTRVQNFPESLTSPKKESMTQVCAVWLLTTRDVEYIKYFSVAVAEWQDQDNL